MFDTELRIEPLSAAAFAPFGDVIETAGKPFFHINDERVERYHDLAVVDADAHGGRAGISLFVAQAYPLPTRVTAVERHPLSSQCFIPLSDTPFLVIVAPAGDNVTADSLRAFLTNGAQGVNYRPGVWHHVLMALGVTTTFAVIDRIGSGPNCDVFTFDAAQQRSVDVVVPGRAATTNGVQT